MSLYPPPEILETEVFAELPPKFRKENINSTWSSANNKGETIHSFIEGPAFDRDGNLYIVDIPWGRIFRVDPSGGFDLVAVHPKTGSTAQVILNSTAARRNAP